MFLCISALIKMKSYAGAGTVAVKSASSTGRMVFVVHELYGNY